MQQGCVWNGTQRQVGPLHSSTVALLEEFQNVPSCAIRGGDQLAPLRVNIESAGAVKTPLWANMASADRAALYQLTADRLPIGHAGDATEFAEALSQSHAADLQTGQVLVVDGGAVFV
jgi:NAD(P)-dependent dehydrogenase (short-subunit alcohol dehydrogenase family)